MHDTFFFTDTHGMYDLHRAIIDYCKEQDPECTIIFGGDACDRGPDGYKMMKELLDDPQIIYIMGNHEDMFCAAAHEIYKHTRGVKKITARECLTREMPACYLSINNGGFSTIEAWINDGMPMDLISRLETLPLIVRSAKVDFCHAGGNPMIFERICEHDGEALKDEATHLMWDRNCLGIGWFPNRTCVFGHTPVNHLASKFYQKDKSLASAHPAKFHGELNPSMTGMKIDMDTGACASGRAFVLNVLTMEAQGFRDTDFENDELEKHNIEKIECIQM